MATEVEGRCVGPKPEDEEEALLLLLDWVPSSLRSGGFKVHQVTRIKTRMILKVL